LIHKFSHEFKDIVAIYGAWLGFYLLGGMSSELVQHLPECLKVIAICSVGYDQYDISALQARGIQLYNTPSLGASDVADTVLWHILESFRYFKRFERQTHEYAHVIKARQLLHTKGFDHAKGQLGVEKDEWLSRAFPFGEYAGGQLVHSPSGKTCGIIGLGRIGKDIATRVQAIGMNVVYHQRTEVEEYKYYSDVQELCRVSDVVVVCCPGNEHTKGMISKEVLDQMKPDAKLINVGRGFIIDEDYAIKRLQQGKLGWIGLDVYTGEPVVDARLLNRCDVSLTPHMASSTKENFDATARYAMSNIWSVLDGQKGQSRVC
jgi:gluconate 2-dehydrogenase